MWPWLVVSNLAAQNTRTQPRRQFLYEFCRTQGVSRKVAVLTIPPACLPARLHTDEPSKRNRKCTAYEQKKAELVLIRVVVNVPDSHVEMRGANLLWRRRKLQRRSAVPDLPGSVFRRNPSTDSGPRRNCSRKPAIRKKPTARTKFKVSGAGRFPEV